MALAELAALEPRIAVAEPRGGPAPAARDTDAPPVCTVLALATPRRAPLQPPPAQWQPATSWLEAWVYFDSHDVWRFACFFAVMTLAFPQLAAGPAYAFGWVLRLLGSRLREVWATFIGTFNTVIGDLWTDVTQVAAEAVQWNGTGCVLSLVAFFVMRRR